MLHGAVPEAVGENGWVCWGEETVPARPGMGGTTWSRGGGDVVYTGGKNFLRMVVSLFATVQRAKGNLCIYSAPEALPGSSIYIVFFVARVI
jgi:hypothetical protein